MAELSSASSSAKQPILRYRRFHGWDYSKGASFFITIATEPRRSLFGRVEKGAMVLSPLGEKVMEALEAIPKLNPGFRLYGHVVMPDHVHLCCHLAPGLAEPLQALGHAIRRFKNYTTKVWKAELAELSSAIPTNAAPSGDGQTAFGLYLSVLNPASGWHHIDRLAAIAGVGNAGGMAVGIKKLGAGRWRCGCEHGGKYQ